MRTRLIASTMLATMSACIGHIGDDGALERSDAWGRTPGPAPIHRLTATQYNNTVRDLFGGSVPNNFALTDAPTVGTLLGETYMKASEEISATVVADLPTLLPCSTSGVDQDACAEQLIRDLGKRAFRRPLDETEVAHLAGVFTWGLNQEGFGTGIELVIQAILQSPHFLYRVEQGDAAQASPTAVPLTSYEIASRMSYLFWNSMPDEELFAVAEAGELSTSDEIAAQARRLLGDERAREVVAEFHARWLDLPALESVSKDPSVFPAFTDELRSLFAKETETFVDEVFWEHGTADLLLDAPFSFMNGPLADFYGVAGPAGDAFERVTVDPSQRSGLLTHASVLSVHAKPARTSPVLRGKFVLDRVLCLPPPPPPDDVPPLMEAADPDATLRERMAEHRSNPACSGCHTLMDGIGLSFEHYDGIGGWRAEENGSPVDATGAIDGTKDANGAFDGAIELSTRLARSEDFHDCLVTHWFRFAHDRRETSDDRASMELLRHTFAESGYDLRDLVVALTQTDAFRYLRPIETEGGTP